MQAAVEETCWTLKGERGVLRNKALSLVGSSRVRHGGGGQEAGEWTSWRTLRGGESPARGKESVRLDESVLVFVRE